VDTLPRQTPDPACWSQHARQRALALPLALLAAGDEDWVWLTAAAVFVVTLGVVVAAILGMRDLSDSDDGTRGVGTPGTRGGKRRPATPRTHRVWSPTTVPATRRPAPPVPQTRRAKGGLRDPGPTAPHSDPDPARETDTTTAEPPRSTAEKKVIGSTGGLGVGLAYLAFARWGSCPSCGADEVQMTRLGEARRFELSEGSFVRIAPGGFEMGSPEDERGRAKDEVLHEVTLTRAFWLGRTEVTQGQWQHLMGSNPASFDDCGWSCPVEQVSWEDALQFLNKLSEKHELPPCYDGTRFLGLDCEGYRLPTEAEWEFAARGGSVAPAPSGDGDPAPSGTSDLPTSAWYEENADGVPHPAGELTPNRWGLHDMLGNVREWVHDAHGDYPWFVRDPTGPESGEFRVTRGGSWDDPATRIRAAARVAEDPTERADTLGFRVARTAPRTDGP
jgi:formylglycine-generating enzyme required for sulfatase activity